MKKWWILSVACMMFGKSHAQNTERIEPIPFGDMEQWCVRYIEESSILGGNTQTIYVIGPNDTIRENKAYDFSKTIWGISNAFASPMGVDKAVCTAKPELRDDGSGYCACCQSAIVTVTALGIIDIRVVVSGAILLGAVNEPVRGIGDPRASVEMGIPFTGRPDAFMMDYRTLVSPEQTLLRGKVGKKLKEIPGHDEPEVFCFLQKRWEEDGKIYAKRIGTMRCRFPETVDWQNESRFRIHYGDITDEPWYDPVSMGLAPLCGEFKARNSKDKMVLIEEVGWAEPDEQPTHVIFMVSAGNHDAWYGKPGNAIWVDNLKWVYEK